MRSLLKALDEYADIPGYGGVYRINKNGKVVRRATTSVNSAGKISKCPDKVMAVSNGRVELSIDGVRSVRKVRELLAVTFIPEYVEGQPVYYISGSEDTLSNLSLNPVSSADEGDQWKDIPGYENLYQASESGDVRSITHPVSGPKGSTIIKYGRILKQQMNGGYKTCILSKDGESKVFTVHRLIASTFIPNPDNKPQVNHIDGDKLNNKVTNLEWVTQSENMQHAKNSGLWSPKHCGDVERDIHGIRVRCMTDQKVYSSITQAAKFYGMDFESVKESILLKRPRKGYQFEYVDPEG